MHRLSTGRRAHGPLVAGLRYRYGRHVTASSMLQNRRCPPMRARQRPARKPLHEARDMRIEWISRFPAQEAHRDRASDFGRISRAAAVDRGVPFLR